MARNHELIAELQMEGASTRRVLERVPMDKLDWQPHAKSMTLGRLATHVAEIPAWVTRIMTKDEVDFTKMDYKPSSPATNEELAAINSAVVAEAVSSLENATDEDFDKMWTLRNGEHVIFTLPRKVAVRSVAMSHNYHHRAQLGVYLRLLDVPVPGVYGPTADDMPPVADKAS